MVIIIDIIVMGRYQYNIEFFSKVIWLKKLYSFVLKTIL